MTNVKDNPVQCW